MTEIAPIPDSPPPETSPAAARPHGCLSAALIGIALGGAVLVGTIWLNSLLLPRPESVGGLAAFYALGLAVPFGLVALLLRPARFALWRGVALALALAGGQAAIAGGLLTLDLALHWPGVPAWAAPLASTAYAVILLALGRRRLIGGRPAAGLVALALALGVLISAPWVVVGALGTWVEVALSLLETLAAGLVSAALVGAVFFYDEGLPGERPFWSAVVGGAVFAALLPGLMAGRGYWIQGNAIWLALLPAGLAAATLLTLGERPRRAAWGVIAFFLLAFLLPLAWTEGLEGDWMIDEMAVAWAPAALAGLLLAFAVGLVALAARRGLAQLVARPAILAGVGAGLLLAVGALCGVFGQPGVQPDTFFVVMDSQADTAFARSIPDRDARYRAVYEALTTHALADQAGLRAWLDGRDVAYTPYYLVNGLEVTSHNLLLRRQIAARPDVARVLDSPQTRPLPGAVKPLNLLPGATYTPGNLSWGVDSIDADAIWEQYGVTGEGVVVGLADSGADWRHPALRSQYLGSEGSHDYTWLDPWYGTLEPTDTGGHGTHTLGTVLGQGGIGVAPGAQWIACRNLARNLGNPATYLDCMQFLFAPYPQGGDPFSDGDPARGADVTNNSWGCPPEEGCDGLTLPVAVRHLADAGQMFVVSAGNEGPACSTVWAPANAEAALSVGAVDAGSQIAFFSSRGPVLVDGSGSMKPEIVAPGVDVISSTPGGGYGQSSGTSMAGPHVTGLVALLWSANPALVGDVDTTAQIIMETAAYIPAPDLCGADTGTQNNVYGAGIVVAPAAVERALQEAP